jgi:hypothetical protein
MAEGSDISELNLNYGHLPKSVAYGMASLRTVPGLRLIGTAREKASVMSFTLAGYTNDEVG